MCLSSVITLAFLYYVIVQINWDSFINNIGDINYYLIFIGILMYLMSYVFRTLRLKIILNDGELHIRDLLSITLLHNLYNRILPARLGDLTLIYFLNRYSKNTIGDSINLFVILRIYDLMISILFLSISYTIIFGIDFVSMLLGILLIVLVFILFKPSIGIKILVNIIDRLPQRYKILSKIKSKFFLINEKNKLLEKNKVRAYLFLYSFSIWSSILILFFLLLESINYNYGFWNTIFSSTVANFSWILPINGIGGFGTMELGWGYAFSILGFKFNEVITTALYINVIVFLATIVFAIIPYFYFIKKGAEK